MTLQEASIFFESLKTDTTNKSEIKIYEKFLHILTRLKNIEFSKAEIQSIEEELDRLHIYTNPKKREKHFNIALRQFEKYLKDTFSIILKGHYTKLGIALGSSFGILFGVVFLSSWERSLGISIGLIFGMLIGLIIGRSMDNKANNDGRVL